jgi:hypothetical protein
MVNLILITSIIKTPNTPLSYVESRSLFTSDERFEQTKKTFETIKEKIPNCKILCIECSQLSNEQNEYFKNNSDYFINLYDNNCEKNKIYSAYKCYGEGTMTYNALKFIIENNIEFNNFFKISGRYWLNDNFNYENFNNNNIVGRYINNNSAIITVLYKLSKNNLINLYTYLNNSLENAYKIISYEQYIHIFIEKEKEKYKIDNIIQLGVSGTISVALTHDTSFISI